MVRNITYSDTGNPILGMVLGMTGLVVAVFSILNPSFFLDLGVQSVEKSYIVMMLLPLGVFAIGLAIIALSMHLINRNVILGLIAFVLTGAALACFAVGHYILWAIVDFVIIVAIMWKIGVLELES